MPATIKIESPPSPFERPGIHLIETRLDTAGLAGGFGTIATSTVAASVLRYLIGEADCEQFAALFLNGKHRITHAHIVFRGEPAQTVPAHPREVFKAVVLANAAAIVVGYNHPSGDVQPSSDDKAVAERLERASKLLGIPVTDRQMRLTVCYSQLSVNSQVRLESSSVPH